MLLTTWKTPTGWVIVRDALTLGPRRGVDRITPHTRPPADEDADHLLVRVAFCLEGEVEIELTCEPVFDYGRVPAEWSVDDDGHTADASGEELTIRLQTDMALGVEGDRVQGPARAQAGRADLLLALLGRGARGRRRASMTPTSASPPPPASGAAGWAARAYPTTAGAIRSSARRLRSRG